MIILTVYWFSVLLTGESPSLTQSIYGQETVAGKAEFSSLSIKDPFQPLYPKKEMRDKQREEQVIPSTKTAAIELPELVVQGLVWGQIKPQAIVDNKVVSIGDIIKGAKIAGISKEGMTILYEGNTFLIKPKPIEASKKEDLILSERGWER